MKSWYKIENKSNNTLDVSLHDEIGLWGITAADFINDIKISNAKTINLSVHSPGGNMLDGLAMYNALKSHKAVVNSHVEGIAASAASTVLMAGDKITMPEDAFLMIHDPHGGVFGDSDDMREYADIMDKLKQSSVNIYANKSGQTDSDISEMMSEETWMNSQEALDNGFIDSITDPIGVSSKADNFNKYFKSMPVNCENDLESIDSIKDFEKFLRDSGGISRRLATALTSRAKVIFQGEPVKQPDNQAMNHVFEVINRLKIPKSLS